MPTLSAVPFSSLLPLVFVVAAVWVVVRLWPYVKPLLPKLKGTVPEIPYVSREPADISKEGDFVSLAVAWKVVNDHVQHVGRREDKESVEALAKLLLRSPVNEKTP